MVSDLDLDMLITDTAGRPETKSDLNFDMFDTRESTLNLDMFTEPKVGKLEAGARGALQGITLGTSDEAEAAIRSLESGDYESELKTVREKYREARESHPGVSLTGELGGGLASAFIPGLGWMNIAKGAKVGTTLVKGAVIGAIAGAGYNEDGEIGRDVAIGAAAGASLPFLVRGLGKGMKYLPKIEKFGEMDRKRNTAFIAEILERAKSGDALDEATIREIKSAVSEEYSNLLVGRFGRWKAELGDDLEREFRDEVLSNKGHKGFMNSVLDRRANRGITPGDREDYQRQIAGLGREQLETMFTRFKESQVLSDLSNTIKKGKIAETSGMTDPLEEKSLTFLKSAGHVADMIDDKFGTNIRDIGTLLTKAERRTTDNVFRLLEPFTSVKAERRFLKLGARETRTLQRTLREEFKGAYPKLYGELTDPGSVGKLSSSQTAAVTRYRNLTRYYRDELNKMGYNISERENYIFKQRKTTAEIKRSLSKYIGENDYRASDDKLMEALTSLGAGNPRKWKKARALDFLGKISKAGDGKARTAGEPNFGPSAISRLGTEIPELLLEMDPSKLTTKYLIGNIRALHMRDPIKQMGNYSKFFRSLGVPEVEKYLNHFVGRVTGSSPSRFHSVLSNIATDIKIAGDNMARREGIPGAVGKVIREVPDIVNWSTAQIYPNALGWNVYATIRNLTQPWAVGAADIGGWNGYGMRVTARGTREAVRNLRGGKDKLSELGMINRGAQLEGMEAAISDELRKTPIGKSLGLVEKFGQMGMKMYTGADTMNRHVTYHVARELAKDLLKGNKSAGAWLNKLPSSQREKINYLIKTRRGEKLMTYLPDMLVERHQFSYTKADLSQFGKDYGRLATMFTKWPTMILGDIDQMARYNEGLQKVLAPMIKYLTPYMAFLAADGVLEATDTTEDPWKKLIVGRSFTNWAPSGAIFQVVETPFGPIPTAVGKILTGKPGEALEPFHPGKYVPRTLGRLAKLARSDTLGEYAEWLNSPYSNGLKLIMGDN